MKWHPSASSFPFTVSARHLLLPLDLLGQLHLALRRLEQRVGREPRELLRVGDRPRRLDRLHPRRYELVVLQVNDNCHSLKSHLSIVLETFPEIL